MHGDGYARLRGKGVSRGVILLKGIVFGNIVRAIWDNFRLYFCSAIKYSLDGHCSINSEKK